MKSIFLATTALVATAGIASADITLNAAANFGIKYMGAADTTTVHNELDFGISATGTSDGGVEFGASLDLDTQSDNSTTTGGMVNDPEAFIAYNGMKLTVGEIDEADDIGNLPDPGYDGIGVDDDAEGPLSNGSHDVRFDYSVSDYAFALTVDSSNDDWAAMASGSFSGFDVALGYNEFGTINVKSLTLGYTFGDVALKAMVTDSSTDITTYGVAASYTTGALTLVAVMGGTDISGDDEDYGIGASYDLGGGLAVAGGIGSVDGNTNADFGVTMKF